jgi:hypothetical protein
MFQCTTPQPSNCLFCQPTLGIKTTTQTGICGGLIRNTENQSSLFSGNQTTQNQGACSGLFGNTGISNNATYNSNLFGAVNTQSSLFNSKSQPTQQGGVFPVIQQGLYASPQNIVTIKPTEIAQPLYMNQHPSYIYQTLSGNALGLAPDSSTLTLIKMEESIKANNKEISELREEIKLLFGVKCEKHIKLNEEKTFKAVNEFNNYILQNDSVESFINKMRLYKDVLINLDDNNISKSLKEGLCSLYNVLLNDFEASFGNLKEKLSEQKIKEDYFSFIVKELKDEILKQNSKVEHLSRTVNELKDETLKQNTKEEYLSQAVKELKDEILKQKSKGEPNKNHNDDYADNNKEENATAVKMCLEESNLNLFSKLVTENQNVIFCSETTGGSQINIEDKLLNKIEKKISFSDLLKTNKPNFILGKK